MKKARILAAVMATALIAGAIPVSPIADFFDSNVITASAETNVVQWDKDKIHQAIDSWSISSVVFLDHKPANGTVSTAGSVSSDDSIVAGPASDTSGIMYIWSADGGKVIAPADCSRLFDEMDQLKSIDLSGLDTSNVTNMNLMFNNCSGLTTLNLSGIDTSSVTNMLAMFENCSGLTKIDLSKFNTSNVTNMGYMFYGCSALTEIDLSKFNTTNVTTMQAMFYNCQSLKELDLISFDTQNVANMSSMFSACTLLPKLDLSKLNTKNVTTMSSMFYNCKSLTELDLSKFDTRNVTSMGSMFDRCELLTELDLSGFDTGNVKYMYQMFYLCSSLKKLNLKGFDTKNVTDMNLMFSGCSKIPKLDLSDFDTNNVKNMEYMLKSCNCLTELDITNFYINDSTNIDYFHLGCTSLTTVACSADTYEKLGFDSDKVNRIVPDGVEKYYVDGYSVDIENGSFTLNVYMDLPDEVSNNKEAFVRFTLPNGTKSDIPVGMAGVKKLNDKYYLIFSVPVAAKDMAKDIMVEIFTDESKKITGNIRVSVKKYAETLAKTTPEYEPFVKAMLNYGEFASNYFNPTDDFKVSYNLATIKGYAGEITASAGINTPNYVGSSLLLKDKIMLRHYFNTKVDGATQKDDLWYVEKAFNPTEFDRKIEGYDYTVNNYLKKVLEGNYDNNLKYLCCALYEYSQAASKLGKN